MTISRLLVVLGVLALNFVRAAEKPAEAKKNEEPPQTREEAFARVGVKLQNGPATVPLGTAAELKLPEGYSFVGKDALDRFYEVTQNMRNGSEVGVVMGPGYMLFFDYADIGYVKDEDKDKLDAEKLMKSMTANEAEANEARKSRGWDEMKLKGWATAPHYDAKTNNLKWAINLSSSQDGFKEVFINESIRLLGRGGVMNVTLVTDTPGFKAAEADAEKLLAGNFSYVAGQKYAEFKAGDKVAAYGLSALVLGGGVAAAAKLGWLAALGNWFGKAWKAIVVVCVALGAALRKLLNKVTGANPEQKPPVA